MKVSIVKTKGLISFLTAFFLCCSTLLAQDVPEMLAGQKQQMPAGIKDAPGEVLKEYGSILSKYNLSKEKERKGFPSMISTADRARLEVLYKKMSKRQQSKQMVAFMPNLPPLPRVVPTDKQLEEWEDSKKYGVWIDGKKVSNTILTDYSNTDFLHATLSKLAKTASDYGKYYYQVNLMTKEYYQEYYNNHVANKNKSIMFLRAPSGKN